MKWDKYILLLLDAADYDVRETANRWKRRYSIPDNMCFSTRGLEDYTKFSVGCLGISDQDTKVLIVGHGSARNLEIEGKPYPPQMIGSTLFYYGLRRGAAGAEGMWAGQAQVSR